MARPIKEGMDYFPHDTDAANDEKIEALRALCGNDGYAFYFILLERIYRTSSFELNIRDTETLQILARKVGVNMDRFQQLLDTALKWGCFDRQAYAKRGVLTSNGIRKRAALVVERREKMRSRYGGSEGVFAAKTREETGEETGAETPQSKVKESKEKKSTEKQSTKDFFGQAAETQSPYGSQKKTKTPEDKANNQKNKYREFVKMTAGDYEKLLQKYGNKQTEAMLDILDNYKGSKGRSYRDDYRAIESWVVKRYHEDQRRGLYHGEARPYPGAGNTSKCSDLREFIQNYSDTDDDMH